LASSREAVAREASRLIQHLLQTAVPQVLHSTALQTIRVDSTCIVFSLAYFDTFSHFTSLHTGRGLPENPHTCDIDHSPSL